LIPLESFPALNASLNGTTAVLLLIGWFLIRAGKREAHRWTMVTAFLVSSVFLACYLWYHAHHGVTHYQKTGLMRIVYFTILGTHTFLAVAVLPIILRALYLAANERFEEHRKAARWAFPIWMYVSVTGVVVYWILYRL
jgi:putative membrane protein